MEFHQLRYFCAVARSGNFTRAAEAEYVSQPSLSQQIRKLEDELGARLFDRFPRSAKLTQFGHTFLPKAQAILRQTGEAKTEIRELAGLETGEVTLGTIPTIGPYLLPSILRRISRRHRGISVRVVEEVTQEILERLHNGRIDIAVLAMPVGGHELVCQELLREKMYAALSSDHPLAHRKTIDLGDISRESFLLLKEGHCFRDNVITACRHSRLLPNIVFESGQFATILAMISAGSGVSVVPQMAIEKRSRCRFVAIQDKHAYRRVGLVQLRNRFRTRAHQIVVEEIKRASRALQK
jgi:LysR family transcriptional regulator, hydrogen peroxide-inducible genes activator